MKIIKRNGSEAVFDITKIIAAITKANHVVPESQRLTKEQIIEISGGKKSREKTTIYSGTKFRHDKILHFERSNDENAAATTA